MATETGSVLDLAVEAAGHAGALLRERFELPRTGVGSKTTSTDMVTDADRASERLIVGRILRARPDDEILGEEGTRAEGTSGLRWTIDPLDGTTNFLFGLPQWSVSIACEDAQGTLIGVVHDALREETFAAVRGDGATLDGEPIRVGAAADLSRALIATGFSYRPDERAAQASILRGVLPSVRDIRRFGSCALDLAWTGTGRFDGFYEVPTMPWDYLAGELIVREAGGVTSRLDPIGPSGPGLVAAGPGLHDALRSLVLRSLDREPAGPRA